LQHQSTAPAYHGALACAHRAATAEDCPPPDIAFGRRTSDAGNRSPKVLITLSLAMDKIVPSTLGLFAVHR